MGKSLLIEIDEATKGIMNDLQSSITANIEGGVSAGLRRISEESQSQLTTLQSALSTKLSTLEEELTNSKKPMTRLSRDVEDVLRLLTKFQASFNEKLAKVEQIQERQTQAINEKAETIFNQTMEKQQALSNEFINQFRSETQKTTAFLTNEVTDMKQSFEAMTTDVVTKLQAQFETLQKEQNEMAKHSAKLQEIESSIEQLMNSQIGQFELMKKELFEASNQTLLAQQNSVQEQLQALAGTREQLVQEMTAEQESFQSEQRQLMTEVAMEVQKANEKLAEEVTNPAPYDRLQQSITQTERTILTGLDQSLILQRLDELQKKLEYANLPFYKKWFTRKEAE